MATSIIKDSVTGNSYSVDPSVAGAAYQPYTPPTTMAPAPTMADVFGNAPTPPTEDTTAGDIYAGYQQDAGAVPDFGTLKKQFTRDAQDRMNALGSVYNDQLTNIRSTLAPQATKNASANTALLAARGLTGSSIGNDLAQTSAAKDDAAILNANTSAQDKYQTGLNTLNDHIDSLAESELAAKRDAKAAGATGYLAHLKDQEARKATYANTLGQFALDQGVDLSTATPAQLQALTAKGTALGISTGDILASYRKLKTAKDLADAKATADATKAKSDSEFNLSEGQARYDSSGNLIAARAKTYAPKSSTGASAGKTVKSGALVYTPEDSAEDSQQLDDSRGADGYADPTLYQDLYNAWIDNGGRLEDFLTQHPPKNYVNPANTWLPVFLRPGGKAAGSLFNSS